MKTSRDLATFAMLMALVIVPVARAQEHPTGTEHPTPAAPTMLATPLAKDSTIVGAAVGAGDLGTFVKAIAAAGLTEKLEGAGPFTVFAPTDSAFAKLPAGELNDLLAPANRARLAGIIANHVVPGKLVAANMKTMKATNVNGHDLAITVHDGEVTVGDARVVEPDLVCANGVIHRIDTVLFPEVQAKPETSKPKDHPAH